MALYLALAVSLQLFSLLSAHPVRTAPLKSSTESPDLLDYQAIKSIQWFEWMLYGIGAWVVLVLVLAVSCKMYKSISKHFKKSSAQKEAELNDDDNDELQQIFDSYDKDKNGQLDKNELQAFMLDANILSRSDPANYNRDLVYAIIQDADGDKDGRISYEEFKKYNSK